MNEKKSFAVDLCSFVSILRCLHKMMACYSGWSVSFLKFETSLYDHWLKKYVLTPFYFYAIETLIIYMDIFHKFSIFIIYIYNKIYIILVKRI